MIGKSNAGWQTTTADLALILFLVVSAASLDSEKLAKQGGTTESQTEALPPSLEPASPTAIYRATAGTTLPRWLEAQADDERQVATVIVKRAGKGTSPAMQEGIAYLDQIEEAGRTARLVVEQANVDDVAVVLAYDRGQGSGMAIAGR